MGCTAIERRVSGTRGVMWDVRRLREGCLEQGV